MDNLMKTETMCIDVSMAGLEGGIPRVYKDVFPSITAREYKEPRLIMEVKQIGNCMTSGDRKNPNQGRIYDTSGLCPTLTDMQGGGRQPMIIDDTQGFEDEPRTYSDKADNEYRVRKITEGECWYLMDFKKEDFAKASKVNSPTQLYRQSGNSICRNVLVAIIGMMIEGKEDVYKNIG